MAERTVVTEINQIGVEVTPGTAVAATKKLAAMGILLDVAGNVDTFRPAGNKYTTIAVPGKDFVTGAVTGKLTYTELIYALSSAVAYAAPVQQGATTAYKWTFTPKSTDVNTIKTYTIEEGSSVRAHKAAYCIFDALKVTINRETCTIGGSVIGQALSDGITITPALTAVELVPVLPTQVNVYLDSTSAGLGTTQLTRVFAADVDLSGIYDTAWPLDSSNGSFAAHYELAPSSKVTLTFEANAEGMAQLAALRAGTQQFLRIQAIGATIAAPYPYTLTMDFSVEVGELPKFGDLNNLKTFDVPFWIIDDSVWGQAYTIDVVNKLTSL